MSALTCIKKLTRRIFWRRKIWTKRFCSNSANNLHWGSVNWLSLRRSSFGSVYGHNVNKPCGLLNWVILAESLCLKSSKSLRKRVSSSTALQFIHNRSLAPTLQLFHSHSRPSWVIVTIRMDNLVGHMHPLINKKIRQISKRVQTRLTRHKLLHLPRSKVKNNL